MTSYYYCFRFRIVDKKVYMKFDMQVFKRWASIAEV